LQMLQHRCTHAHTHFQGIVSAVVYVAIFLSSVRVEQMCTADRASERGRESARARERETTER
jgi:hypothetical protein